MPASSWCEAAITMRVQTGTSPCCRGDGYGCANYLDCSRRSPLVTAACGGRTGRRATRRPRPLHPEQMAELWIDPGAAAARSVLGHRRPEVRAAAGCRLHSSKAKDDTGFSVSYDVTSPDGTRVEREDRSRGADRGGRVPPSLGTRLSPAADLLPAVVEARCRRAASRGVESEARFRPKLPTLERARRVLELGRQSRSAARASSKACSSCC